MSHLWHIRRKSLAHLGRRALLRTGLRKRRALRSAPYSPSAIPRVLWMYWEQGFANAPPIVQACVASWKAQNPGWDIRLLDATCVNAHVDCPALPEDALSAHRADVLRTRLLNVHGGVWADATTWCLRPLDEWLPILGYAGFFAFNWDNSDAQIISGSWPRKVGNWFIAAAAGNALIKEWDRISCDYWQGRETAGNYFWHNDALEYAIGSLGEAAKVWDAMPKVSAGPAHFVWLALEHGQDEQAARDAIATRSIPLQKLSWRMKASVGEIEAFF